MSGALPSRINPFRLAEQGTCIQGAVPLAHMHRLGEVLLSQHGEAEVLLRFATGAGGLYVVIGQVRALLEMQCQRCLLPVTKTIDRPFKLAMARSEAEAIRLQAEHEILDVEDEAVFTRDLVEDEVLLSLPLIPVHDDPAACDAAMLDQLNSCRAEIDDNAPLSTRNAFTMLRHLKKS
jgi:uncharacterized protein